MLYLLLLILSAALFFLLKNIKGYLVTPIIVFIGSFWLAVFVVALNPNWIMNFSLESLLIIVVTMFSFGIGQFSSRCVFPLKKQKKYHDVVLYNSNKSAILMLLFEIFAVGFQIAFLLRVGGFSLETIVKARQYMLDNPDELPAINGHIVAMSFAIAAVYSFFGIRSYFERKTIKKNYLPLLMLFCYILVEIFSTSRAGLIYFSAYIMAIIIYFFQKKMNENANNMKKQKKKLLKVLFIISTFIGFMFVSLGLLTGKTIKQGAMNMISSYFGGSIYNLDWFLKNGQHITSPFPGYFTFPIISSIGSRILGINKIILERFHFPMNQIPTVGGLQKDGLFGSNLYTCIVRPMTDFGVLGMFIYYYILGFCYGAVFYSIRRKKESSLLLILYGYMIQPLCAASAEHCFAMFLFSPLAIYRLFYIAIFYYLCFTRHNFCSILLHKINRNYVNENN